jgi:hypothetical protein
MITRLLCEFPAGLACLSLHVHGRLKPPVPRPGVKTGYAKSICENLGLTGAEAYWWAEADPDVAALIGAYACPEALFAIAGIIRGWVNEEPKKLWTRLRDERKRRISEGTSLSTLEAIAECAQIVASNRLISVGGPALRNTGKGGTTFGGAEFAIPAAKTAAKFEEIAKSILLDRWSFSSRGWRAGYGGPGCEVKTDRADWTTEERDRTLGIPKTADRVEGLRSIWPPVRVTLAIPSAEEVAQVIGTPGDLDGVVVYMDPPYVGTSGYLHDLPRSEVIRLARSYDALGAVVCISEAEVIDALDWHSTEIFKTGNARTFSKQKREFLTVNRPIKAAWSVSSMFSRGADCPQEGL